MILNNIYDGRCSGRTVQLIKNALKYNNPCIVCPNEGQAKYIWNIIRKVNLERRIRKPVTFRHFIEGKCRDERYDAFLFDNLDCSLSYFTCGSVIDTIVTEKPVIVDTTISNLIEGG